MPDGPRLTSEALRALGGELSAEDNAVIVELSTTPQGFSVPPSKEWGLYAAALVSSTRIEKALHRHAEALTDSAAASEKYTAAMAKAAEESAAQARAITRATWALVIATGGLIVIAIAGAAATIIGACIAKGGC